MRRLLIVLLLLLLAGTALFFWLRPDEGAAAIGPPVALCPGPDLYGYTCADGSEFAYVDATEDTGLQRDDGAVRIPLPFPFTFYGTIYESVWAGSNGVLQFGAENSVFTNRCLDEGPAAGMGEMVAPYWDDLDLTLAGALETEVVGVAPERILVVEWDEVPAFARPDDTVTFAVQLHEGSNYIVFLYPDPTLGEDVRGSGATIGLQSEAQGLALQYSCNQAVIGEASALHFLHPAQPNEEIGLEASAALPPTTAAALPALKGPAATLQAQFSSAGKAALPALRRHWLSQSQPLLFTWEWADLDGRAGQELIALWRGPEMRPEAAQIALFRQTAPEAPGEVARLAPLYLSPLSTREIAFARPHLSAVRDVTGDGLADLLLQDVSSNRLAVLVFAESDSRLHYLPHACSEPLAVHDVDGDGLVDLLRAGCGTLSPKTIYSWQTDHFSRLSP